MIDAVIGIDGKVRGLGGLFTVVTELWSDGSEVPDREGGLDWPL
jgi:hypothetical protein